jgi:hypothetical protein
VGNEFRVLKLGRVGVAGWSCLLRSIDSMALEEEGCWFLAREWRARE